MIKLIGLMKRNPEISHEEYKRYYEDVHRAIGERNLRPFANRYLRRYLTPLVDPVKGAPTAQLFDSILEIWYPDQEALDASHEHLAKPEVVKEVIDDTNHLFDYDQCVYFLAEDVESSFEG